MMLSLRRLILQNHPLSSTPKAVASPLALLTRHEPDHLLPSNPHFQRASQRFLDIYQMGNKEAIAKERARISDEMNRGYFADISEMKKHGGKIAMANKTIIPAMVAVKFPSLEVNFSNGRNLKLPISSENCQVDTAEMAIPSASLICLSFRASSQAMIESWTAPFLDAFRASENIRLYEWKHGPACLLPLLICSSPSLLPLALGSSGACVLRYANCLFNLFVDNPVSLKI